MSTIPFISSLYGFLTGLTPDEVSALHYKEIQETKRRMNRKTPHDDADIDAKASRPPATAGYQFLHAPAVNRNQHDS